jgi:hypothetical protein
MKAVNLIPTDQRRVRTSAQGSRSSYAALGVLAVLLVMALVFVLTANSANDNQTKATKDKREADALEAKAAALDSFTNFAAIKEARLAAVKTAADQRFDWERLMREVSRIMPDGSWLQTTEASVLGEETATPAVPGVVAGPASPTATFVGCTPKQAEVAKILVRLRGMHRVEDVELNESMREDGVTEVSVDSCGPFYKFDVTVTFSPADPPEAPRGASSVPASLGGGS